MGRDAADRPASHGDRPGVSRRGFLRGLEGFGLAAILSACGGPAHSRPVTSPTRTPTIKHRFVNVNGIRMHIAEAGTGPLVLLLHGWPEFWYSWRHQIPALAAAGYHVVAPDQRGYGQTDRPARVGDYAITRLVDDVTGLIDALGERRAVVVGHDWGAIVAWNTALMRPDRVRAVSALSVPHRWAEPQGESTPVASLRSAYGDHFYIVHFQQPGVADADMARDPRAFFRGILYSGSGDGPGWSATIPKSGRILDSLTEPRALPAWLSERDVDTYAAQFTKTGFTGGLNWYRNFDTNWTQTARWRRTPIQAPALYIVGDRDKISESPQAKELITGRSPSVPNLKQAVVLPGRGHWIQQEEPDKVNESLIRFLRSL